MANLPHRTLSVLLAAAALCGAPDRVRAQDGEEKKEELTREEFKKLREKRKAATVEALKKAQEAARRPSELSTVILRLERYKHPLVVVYVQRMLNYQNLRQPGLVGQIRGACAQVLSAMKEDPKKGPVLYPTLPARASKALKRAVNDRWNRKEVPGRQVMRVALEGLGKLGDRSAKDVLLKYMSKADPYLAESAIRGLGHLRDIDTIERIIREWQSAENRGDRSGANDKDKERLSVIAGAAGDVLARLTGEQFDDPDDWAQWWRDNKRGFKLKPKPEEG